MLQAVNYIIQIRTAPVPVKFGHFCNKRADGWMNALIKLNRVGPVFCKMCYIIFFVQIKPQRHAAQNQAQAKNICLCIVMAKLCFKTIISFYKSRI